MQTPTLQQLTAVLRLSWCKETSFVADEWTIDNPARGQCVVSSLVVQDYYGGDLMRYRVTGPDFKETHYCNVLSDGTIVDTTGSQYQEPVTLRVDPIQLDGYPSRRDKRLANDATRTHYMLLKRRVMENFTKLHSLALNEQ